MTSYTVDQFQQAARVQLADLGEVKQRVLALRSQNETSRGELSVRLQTVRDELVASLLPYFTPEHLAWAAQVTGYTGLVQKGFPQQAEAERAERTAKIAAIEADPRYRDRKLLRDPLVGKLTRAIAELEEFRQPFAEVARRCQHPRLPRLLDSGYGTPRYDVPFWRMSYYGDWKAGDEILERFPEATSFGDVVPRYLEAAQMLATYDPRLAELREEVRQGEQLERDRSAHQEALESLEPRYLGLARVSLAQHLSDLPPEALGELLSNVPAVAVTVKKWSGLAHQLRYLEAIGQAQIQPALQQVERDIGKLQKDVTKYSRPKNYGTRFASGDFERRFDRSRTQKVRSRLDRVGWTHDRVSRFDRYERASLASDFLWWDLMTDGKVDGDFIPEVKHFRDVRQSQGLPRTSSLADDDLAAASAAVSGTRPGRDARDAS